MKMVIKHGTKDWISKILTGCIAAGFFFAIEWLVGIYYETNDERYIASILAGMFTMEAEAHAIHINFFLSLPLMLLYRLNSSISWFGIALILFQWFAFWGILDGIIATCRTWYSKICAGIIVFSVFGGFCYIVGQIQYTSTAMLLAVAGYVCLLCKGGEKQSFILFFVYEMLAFLLRRESMLLMIPLGVGIWGIYIIMHWQGDWREKLQQVCKAVGVLGVAIVVALVGNQIGYHSEDWEMYHRFNDARTGMFDYYGKPNSDSISNILQKYDVSVAKYNAFCSGTILDWEQDVECVEEIEKQAKQNYTSNGEVPIKAVWNQTIKRYDWDINKILCSAWILLGCWILLGRRWRMLGVVLLFGGVRTIVWSWLFWRGRILHRVTIPLMFAEVVFLGVLLWLDISREHGKKWRKGFIISGYILLCVVSLDSARMQYRYLEKTNAEQQQYIKGFKELQAYCNANQDKRYLIDSIAVSWYKGSAVDSEVTRPMNAVVSGGWFANSPIMQRRVKEYLCNTEDGFYVILYADGNPEKQPIYIYLEEKVGGDGQLVDWIKASHGGEYAVYFFDGPFTLEEGVTN